jgi:hypothetical protein
VPGKVERQHLEVRLNGHQAWSEDLTSLAFERSVVSLPAAFVVDKDNVLAFVLPNATAPSALGPSDDHRRLGIAVRGIREAISIPDIHLGRADADRFLRDGWSYPEADFRWTNSPTAEVRFESETRRASAIELELSPYLVAGKVDKQHVELVLNGRSIWNADLRAPGFAPYLIALPPDALKARNVLGFRLADAISPSQVEQSNDVRRLGIAVRVIRSGRRGADTAQDAGAPRPW